MKMISIKNLTLATIIALTYVQVNGQDNTAYGDGANPSNTGNLNSVFGSSSLRKNVSGNYNSAFGVSSLYHNIGGSSNVAIGVLSLGSNVSGSSNTATGSWCLTSNDVGVENTGNGFEALSGNTSGSYNTGIGVHSLGSSVGYDNTATGHYSLASNGAGSGNTANGAKSLYASHGDYNTGSGSWSLYSNTSGSDNTAHGTYSLYNNITGSNNTALGYRTGLGITTGSGNTIVGANVAGLSPTLSNTIIIADGTGNQRLYIDNTGKTRIGSPTLTIPGNYKLYVEQGILTEKVVVALANSTSWADYVFAADYKLRPLAEVAFFVKENHHLPNVPSGEEVFRNGINVGELNGKLLEKIEELTLYLIEQSEEVKALKDKVTALEAKK